MIGAAGAVVLVPGACGGSGSSDAGRTLPPVASTASSPTADLTTSAPLTRKQELAAAEAVVRRYFQVLNQLPNKMDAGSLGALLTPGCGCQKQVRSTRFYARRGGRYVQRGRIKSIGGRIESPSAAQVLVRFSATAGGVRMPDGRIVNRTPAIPDATDIFFLTSSEGRWRIAQIETAGQA